MTRLEALIELRDKVKAGIDPNEIAAAMPCQRTTDLTYGAFRGSLDAAKALHEAVLPGWGAAMEAHGWAIVRHPTKRFFDCQATSETPARAWLLAILEALIAIERALTQATKPRNVGTGEQA